MKTKLFLLVGTFLSGCIADQPSAQSNAAAVGADAEIALARSVFIQLQPLSIAENVEFCGYIGFDRTGQLVSTRPTRGEEGSCLADDPANLEIITASYHTHGGFSSDYFNEVPSVDDIEGDEAEGIDGYVATPGGRMWYIDTEDMEVSQLCGVGCLPADPLFQPGSDGIIAQSYTYNELVEKLGE